MARTAVKDLDGFAYSVDHCLGRVVNFIFSSFPLSRESRIRIKGDVFCHKDV